MSLLEGNSCSPPDLPDSVHAIHAHLNSLRGRQAVLLRQLEQINEEIQAVETKRARIDNENASISKLPPELLSRIFLLCQKDSEHNASQFTASRVCSRWRNLSNGTALLWTKIRITLEHIFHVPSRLHKLETHLTRSGPSGIFTAHLDVHTNLDFSPFLKLIASHISRCSRLSISVLKHPKACLLLREYLEYLQASQLNYLSIHVDWADSGPYDRVMSNVPLIFKGGAPLLTSLQLTGIASALRPPISSDITTLHLDGVYMLELTVYNYRNLLAATPSLVNLSLRGLKIDKPSAGMEEALELPRLRSLRCRAKDTDHPFTSANSLFTALPLHQLESLVLCDVDNLWLFDFPNVKDLSLHGCGFGVSHIGHLMLAFPSVVSLTLESASLLYMALSIEGRPVWWPNLRVLCVRDLAKDDAPTLLKMVQGRAQMNRPLEIVCLNRSSRRRASGILDALENLTKVSHLGSHAEPWPPGADAGLLEDDSFWDDY
ncbi:hypothetical protein J3R30DRAFT_3701207 [Lentinula aciculospora]|uniref:F-box domain-containing protein n=1 Tax=Lentinula aciculospora TaxID=153920 RepID=A0A9W9AE46_9AGAR|nr:hypothetical protein J3R30DRAFT_3701207 [Lentinula aciculospora]